MTPETLDDWDNKYLRDRGWRIRRLIEYGHVKITEDEIIQIPQEVVIFEDPLTGLSYKETGALHAEHLRQFIFKRAKRSLIVRLIEVFRKLVRFTYRQKTNNYLSRCWKAEIKG